jgi:hypothetical protein
MMLVGAAFGAPGKPFHVIREIPVPRFLDMHVVPAGEVTPELLAQLHKQDLAVQDKYGVKYFKYWFDAATGKVFCLSEAPSKEAALAVHREAHGEMPDDIFEVEEFE